MPETSFTNMLDTLERSGSINAQDRPFFEKNYTFFETQRPDFEEKYKGQWVAVLDECVHAAPSQRELDRTLKTLPNSKYAYSAQI